MKHTLALFTLLCLVTCISLRARAEGSTQVGTAQRLQSTTSIRVDIIDFANETISWTGQGTAQIRTPANMLVATLSSGQSYQPTLAGTFSVTLSTAQTGNWDISVSNTRSGYGRVHAQQWDYNTGTFAQGGASSASYYALVPGGSPATDGVVELKLNGLSGNQYSIGANRTGVDGDDAGRSVPTSANNFTPSFEMYLLPPETGRYNPITPVISNFRYGSGAQGCGLITIGNPGTFAFTANVEATYNLVCDLDNDQVFNRVASTDLLLVGLTVNGSNAVAWDGKNNAGVDVSVGSYNCKVFVNTGELHFVGQDIETSYQGLQLYGVDNVLTRTPLNMFWNDSAVQSNDVNMPAPTSTVGAQTSGANGVSSGSYGVAAVANVTAHSWGNFTSGSKGNNAFIDTFASILSTASAPVSVQAVAANADSDSDGLNDYLEACTLGTNANNPDSDGDTVSDFVETNGGSAINTDSNGGIDALDTDSDDDGVEDGVDVNRISSSQCRDQDADSCDDCAIVHAGGGSVSNDGTDTDMDGACNGSDPDDDGDGVPDNQDSQPLDPNACKDSDNDTCDDCAVVHSGGGSAPNDGLDSDMDGACDSGDPDDDNDGVPDSGDGASLDSNVCRDQDGDGCNDCAVVHTAGGSVSNDGPDADGDGQCDLSDGDDDNDGVADGSDSAPSDARRCKDGDGDGCDDCAVTGADGSGGDPKNDGPDSNQDGMCDAAIDTDRDGVVDVKDLDIDGDGIPNTDEGDADKDGDGLDNAHDLDSDGDGIADLVEAGGTDENGDGKVDDAKDANKDGLDDRIAGAPLPRPDTDDDGLRDFLDLDSDGDGASDVTEAGGDALDLDHDGRVDDKRDANRNGWSDAVDNGSDLEQRGERLPIPDTDGDGTLDFRDLDSDADGVPDAIEAHDADRDGKPDVEPGDDANGDGWRDGYKTSIEPPDSDEDGLPDYQDVDDDDDGRSTVDEVRDQKAYGKDVDGDGIPNYLDDDSDADDVPDRDENRDGGDVDGDDTPDYVEPRVYPEDRDGDGVLDFRERTDKGDAARDTDEDGTPDAEDDDDDGDGIPTRVERVGGNDTDSDGDGTPDYLDADDDDDGIPTRTENTSAAGGTDIDRDGTPNYLDLDSDADGLSDARESLVDANGNGVPDYREPPRVGFAGGAGCAVAGSEPQGHAPLLLVLGVWSIARRRRSKA